MLSIEDIVLTPPCTPKPPRNKILNIDKKCATAPSTDVIIPNINKDDNNNDKEIINNTSTDTTVTAPVLPAKKPRGRPKIYKTEAEKQEAQRANRFRYCNKALIEDVERIDGELEDLRAMVMIQQRRIDQLLDLLRDMQD